MLPIQLIELRRDERRSEGFRGARALADISLHLGRHSIENGRGAYRNEVEAGASDPQASDEERLRLGPVANIAHSGAPIAHVAPKGAHF